MFIWEQGCVCVCVCVCVCSLLQWGICSSRSLSLGNSCSFMSPHTTVNKPKLAYERTHHLCVCVCVRECSCSLRIMIMIMEIRASVTERSGESAAVRCGLTQPERKQLRVVRIHLRLQLQLRVTGWCSASHCHSLTHRHTLSCTFSPLSV